MRSDDLLPVIETGNNQRNVIIMHNQITSYVKKNKVFFFRNQLISYGTEKSHKIGYKQTTLNIIHHASK